MGPLKTAHSTLHCDGCGEIILAFSGQYGIDASGYLLCADCVKNGDLKVEGV